jgi:hypothetical protein
MRVHELWTFVAEPNLFGESSGAPCREHNTPEGGSTGETGFPREASEAMRQPVMRLAPTYDDE